ncbi:hypothetical protein [Nonomuraea sp. NPDC049028]|uniref:hypothetical protein n=1 Tax=Nonomuraea sp. NPDC049028 TaxID=3364348 RepID=UPI0037237836
MSYLAPTDNQGLMQFLSSWYGSATFPNSSLREASAAPRELVEWHDISARWHGAITSHNYPIPVSELTPEDGKVPFWVENQGTWAWAFDPDDEAHWVYEREPSDNPNPWTRTGEQLSDFLIHATVIEAILGAPATKFAREVQADWIQSQEGSRELGLPAWNWPTRDSRIFLGEQWLALVHPSDEPKAGYDVTLAATTPEHLAWVENTPEIKWHSYSAPQNYTTEPFSSPGGRGAGHSMIASLVFA